MSTWPIKEAKSRLSEVLSEAETHGPQIITVDGVEKAVVLSISEYRALTAEKFNFKEHLFNSPLVDHFDVPRSRDTGRKIRL